MSIKMYLAPGGMMNMRQFIASYREFQWSLMPHLSNTHIEINQQIDEFLKKLVALENSGAYTMEIDASVLHLIKKMQHESRYYQLRNVNDFVTYLLQQYE